jgi:hypothetical protein
VSDVRTEMSAPATAGAHRSGRDVRDILEGVVLVAAAAVVWVAASRLPGAPVKGELGSNVWPETLAIALGACGAALLVEAVRGRVAHDESLEAVNRAQWPVLAACVALIAAFLIAWPAVGFVPSAIVSFVLLSRLLGVGNWVRSAAWGTGLALVMWVLFEELLNIPL